MNLEKHKVTSAKLEQICLEEIKRSIGLSVTETVKVKRIDPAKNPARHTWDLAGVEPNPGGTTTWQAAFDAVLPLQRKYDLE